MGAVEGSMGVGKGVRRWGRGRGRGVLRWGRVVQRWRWVHE